MSHVFISYARQNIDIAGRIVQALAKNDLDTWIDWKSIPKGEDWEQEIYRGIEEADAFLFLISPDSVASQMCNKEITHAVRNGKRILPIFIGNGPVAEVQAGFYEEKSRQEISRRNYTFCREGKDDFNKAIEEVKTALQIDYGWLKYHTKLQVKALDWERNNDNSRLLRGKELQEAIQQLAKAGSQEDPQSTDSQRQYVQASQKHEKRIRLWLVGSLGTALLLILGFAVWPFLSREQAIPGQWVPVTEGPFKMGMDQDEADFAYSLCSRDNSIPENCYFTSKELLTFSGMQGDASLLDFEIMDNEVTIAQYLQCVMAGACLLPDNWNQGGKGINEPAAELSWPQSTAYCTWLGGRLPTEGEWEKAARGPEGNYFPWGSNWETNANLEGGKGVQSINLFAKSDISYYKVKNMAGNVREWTASERPPQRSPEFDNLFLKPEDFVDGIEMIVRGGSWINDRSIGLTSNVGWMDGSSTEDNIGFRCVCSEPHTCREPWSTWWKWFGDY